MENSAFRSPAEPDGARKIRLSENYQKNRLCGVAPGRHGSQFWRACCCDERYGEISGMSCITGKLVSACSWLAA